MSFHWQHALLGIGLGLCLASAGAVVACGSSSTEDASNRIGRLGAPLCDSGQAVPLGADSAAAICLDAGWTAMPHEHSDDVHRFRHSSGLLDSHWEPVSSLDAAVERLRQTESETPGNALDVESRLVQLEGWPALIRRASGWLSVPSTMSSELRQPAEYVSLALAQDRAVLRVSAVLTGEDRVAVAERLVKSLGQPRVVRYGDQALAARHLEGLRRAARFLQGKSAGDSDVIVAPFVAALTESGPEASEAVTAGVNQLINNSADGFDSEIEIAASADGRIIVVGNNGRELSTSIDGGVTFSLASFFPGAPFTGLVNGDPSLAVAQSGTFYFAFIGFPGQGAPPLVPCTSLTDPNCNTSSNEIASATRATLLGGGGFSYLGPMVASPQVSTPNGAPCFFPDQEHIATDRFNASTSPAGADLVYTTWRNFVASNTTGFCLTTMSGGNPQSCDIVNCAGGGSCSCNAGDSCVQQCLPRSGVATAEGVAIRCSSNSGASFGNQVNLPVGTSYPRITVGPSGAVYVVYRTQANGGGTVMIDKFGSCDGRLTPPGLTGALRRFPNFPRPVTNTPNIAGGPNCPTSPIPGIDRCNSGSELSSPMVAVDDQATNDPTMERVFVSFANSTSNSNEDVLIVTSTDGGMNFGASTQLNANTTGRRFMPWICATGGQAFVSWYDMRNATSAATADLADYFGRGLSIDGSGNVALGTEVRLSQVSDPLCQVGWTTADGNFTGTRCPGCSDSCPTQPQNAGTCWDNGMPCDFDVCSATPPAGQGNCPCGATPPAGTARCQTGGGGPKYGDYNGNTCAAGRFFSGWASSTAPAGQGPTQGIDVFFACPPDPEVSTIGFGDSTPPMITAPADIDTGTCDPIDLGDPDSFDVCGSAPTVTQSPNINAFPPGETEVTWTATDDNGNEASDVQTITVTDVTPPDIVCPGDQVAECIDGAADVDYGEATATDSCGVDSVDCQPPSGSFPLGSTTVTCTATDTSDNTAECNLSVDVVDTIPPEVSVAGGGELWPPEHQYVQKALAECGIEINDQCQGLIDLEDANPLITCVTSDEPDNSVADGDTDEDIVIVDATTVLLRAERAGNRDGRVYTLHFQVSDAADNVQTAECQVSVRNNQDGVPAVDSGVAFSVGTCP